MTCPGCGGAGQVVHVEINENGEVSVTTKPCPSCAGTGKV